MGGAAGTFNVAVDFTLAVQVGQSVQKLAHQNGNVLLLEAAGSQLAGG